MKLIIVDIISVAVALLVALIAIKIALSNRQDQFFMKWFESFNQTETSKEMFIGKLNAFNFTEQDLMKDNLTIETLMFYEQRLMAFWIGNKTNIKRIKRVRSKKVISYTQKVERAITEDKKDLLIHPDTMMGKIIGKPSFNIAWNKYLKNYWDTDPSSIVAVIIEASLYNINKSEDNSKG